MNSEVESEYGESAEEPRKEDEYNIPDVEPGLGDIRDKPEVNKDKKPSLLPDEMQEIIDAITEEEEDDKDRENEVDDIIKKIHE